jgi:hypothetical protein
LKYNFYHTPKQTLDQQSKHEHHSLKSRGRRKEKKKLKQTHMLSIYPIERLHQRGK